MYRQQQVRGVCGGMREGPPGSRGASESGGRIVVPFVA
jgi:hypothetical protein